MFNTLQELQNKKNPMEIGRAIAMKDIAQVIINSAKVEVEHMRVSGGNGSGFIPMQSADGMTVATQLGNKIVTSLPNGASVTQHRMRD